MSRGLLLCFNQSSNGFLRSRHLPDVVASSAEWAAYLEPWREGDSIWWFHFQPFHASLLLHCQEGFVTFKRTNCRKLQKSTASWLYSFQGTDCSFWEWSQSTNHVPMSTASWLHILRHRLLVLRMVTINKSCANVKTGAKAQSKSSRCISTLSVMPNHMELLIHLLKQAKLKT
jgi:hypothetical protein